MSKEETELEVLNPKISDGKKQVYFEVKEELPASETRINPHSDFTVRHTKHIMMHHVGYFSTTPWRLFSLVLNSMLFAYGNQWKSLVFVILYGHYDYNPRDVLSQDLGCLWLATLIFEFLLIIIMGGLIWYKRRIKNDNSSQIRKDALLGVIDSIVNWAICYGMAVTLFNAIECSLKRESVAYQIVYVFGCIFALAILNGMFSGGIIANGPNSHLNRCLGSFEEDIGKAVFNGSVWGITVMWVNTSSYIFGLDNIGSHNINYLCLYTLLLSFFGLISIVGFWKAVAGNHEDVKNYVRKNTTIKEDDTDQLVNDVFGQMHTLTECWFYLYLKSLIMILSLTVWTTFYVLVIYITESGVLSIYQPLRLGAVTTFLLITVLLMCSEGMVFDLIIRWLMNSIQPSFASQDLDVPSTITTIFNSYKEEVIEFFGVNVMTAYGLIFGITFSYWSSSLWRIIADKLLRMDQICERTGVMVGYLVFLTVLVIWSSKKICEQQEMGSQKRSNL